MEGEKINMMTMHAAKGLGWCSILPGWEEVFPHQKSIEEKGQNGLEEERRLAYVGLTRAKKKIIFFQWIDFIKEIGLIVWHQDLLRNFWKIFRKKFFFDENKKEDVDEFEFNQDFEDSNNINSPGWIRYQKLNDKKRIKSLVSKFKKYKIDGYVIPKNDEFFQSIQRMID